MPDLCNTMNVADGTMALVALEDKTKDKEDKNSNNNKMVHTCKRGCKYTLVINVNPYQATLDLDYGENMMRVKKDCHLPLLHCFRDKKGGGRLYV